MPRPDQNGSSGLEIKRYLLGYQQKIKLKTATSPSLGSGSSPSLTLLRMRGGKFFGDLRQRTDYLANLSFERTHDDRPMTTGPCLPLIFDATQAPAAQRLLLRRITRPRYLPAQLAVNPLKPISVAEKVSAFSEYWQPRVVGQFNGTISWSSKSLSSSAVQIPSLSRNLNKLPGKYRGES